MAVVKVLIFLAVILAISTASPLKRDAKETNEVHRGLPDHTVPKHYDIKLMPRIGSNNFTFDGAMTVYIKIREETSRLVLHSENLIIHESVTILKTKFKSFEPTEHIYDTETSTVILTFPEILQPGYYSLHLAFSNILDPNSTGFISRSYEDDHGNEVWFAFTDFRKGSAHMAFPCWNEPRFKASFSISLQHHSNYTAVSNTPVLERSNVDGNDGMLWTRFKETPVMATDKLAFVISDFDHISNDDGTIAVWYPKSMTFSANFLFENVQKTEAVMQRYTNMSRPSPKMDHVLIPNYYIGHSNYWGIALYPDYGLVYTENEESIITKLFSVTTAVHKVTDQWLNDLTKSTSWNFALNEAISKYFLFPVINEIFKDTNIMDILPVLEKNIFLADTASKIEPINITDVDFDNNNYDMQSLWKMSTILSMMAHALGEEVFHKGLVNYLKSPITSPQDTWSVFQEALDKSNVPHSEWNVNEMMTGWLTQYSVPVVKVHRNYETGKMTLTQTTWNNEFTENSSEEETEKDRNNAGWWIPINFATSSNPDFSNTLPKYWLKPNDTLIIDGVDPNDWVIFNVQQTGYYVVVYDIENWKRIAAYLNSDNYRNIHVINRAQFIFESMYMLAFGKLDPATALTVLNYLGRETHHLPWSMFFDTLQNSNRYSKYTEESTIFKSYIWQLTDKAVQTINFEENPNDTDFMKLYKYLASMVLCMYDHPLCIKSANSELIKYLDNSEEVKIQAHKKYWVFCNGLRNANESVWNRVFNLYVNENQTVLNYLGCSRDPSILKKYLDMTLWENSPIREEDILSVYRSLTCNTEENRNVLYDFLLKNQDRVISRVNDTLSLATAVMYSIVTREELSKMKDFLLQNGIKESEIDSEIEESVEKYEKYLPLVQHLLQIIGSMIQLPQNQWFSFLRNLR